MSGENTNTLTDFSSLSSLFEQDSDSFDTILEQNINFKGRILFKDPLMIRGKVTGEIETTGDLYIDKLGQFNGTITADRVLIKGEVKANIKAASLVFVSNGGVLIGDISTKEVVLEPGSKYSGQCTMTN